MNQTFQNTAQKSILQALRRLIPIHESVTFGEALSIAEIQAARLLELLAIDELPVPSEVVSELPRIRIEYSDDLPTSGLSYWTGDRWIIQLSERQPRTRQRFTLFHEYKHIIDHGSAPRLYRGDGRHDAAEQAELVADFFAGCVLMPRRALKRAWGDGTQNSRRLAELFDVSQQAIEVRLDQTGLRDQPNRGDWSGSAPRWWRNDQHRSGPSSTRGVNAS